jgi:hypothetical protein
MIEAVVFIVLFLFDNLLQFGLNQSLIISVFICSFWDHNSTNIMVSGPWMFTHLGVDFNHVFVWEK